MSTPDTKDLVQRLTLECEVHTAENRTLRNIAVSQGETIDKQRAEVERLTAERDALLIALQTADRTFAENGLLACHAARKEIRAAIDAAMKEQL